MNESIRQAANDAGVWLWQIAEELGISDTTFSKKLRRELPAGQKETIFEIIEKLSNGVGK